MPSLEDRIFEGGVWVNSAVRLTNTVGAPVTSADDADDGRAIPDEYSLTVSGVAGGTATITVSTASPNNPYKGRVVNAVPLDGATVVRNIIPGVNIVMSAGAANGNTATVKAGVYLGTFDAFGVGAGVPSAGLRHKVVNTGSGTVHGAAATLETMAILTDITNRVFAIVEEFAPGATEKVVGGSTRVDAYKMAIANVAGAGVLKTADLTIDGGAMGAASIRDLDDNSLVSGVGLMAVANKRYRVETGPLTGVEFALDPDCANGDRSNILIFPSRYVQIAREVGGVADAADWGTDDVVLTQAGQAAGDIAPAGEAFYWSRINVPPGGGPESNPYPAMVAVGGQESGMANYLAP